MFQHIVVGVANTASSLEAFRQARELAELAGAKLEIVTAFKDDEDDAEARRHAESLVERLAQPRLPSGVRTHALPGRGADAILMVADEVSADLIVVGNQGMQGVRRVLGSVPNDVAHKAECSVLIINTNE
jgi:nucleotide-binding universal stress UspA family protein